MASVLSAKLDRTDSSTPWGFRLHGGKDFSAPLTIQRVSILLVNNNFSVRNSEKSIAHTSVGNRMYEFMESLQMLYG